MGSQDITTIVGNSSGDQNGINLDNTLPYSKRARDDVEIDINEEPDFSYGDVLDKQFDDFGGSSDEVEDDEDEEEEENEDEDEEESDTESIPTKKVKNEESQSQPKPKPKTITLKPHNIKCERAKILLEFFFLSLPKEKWDNPRVEDVFKECYILDLKPRFLKGTWDCDDFEMNVNNIMSSNWKSEPGILEFGKEDPNIFTGDFENSSSVQIHDYSLVWNKDYFDTHLQPPQEREGEKLFVIIRTFHCCCYFPFIREEFPKDILSEEQLVWVSHELGTEDKSLSRLELWKETKKAFIEKCYSNDVFKPLDRVMNLLLCVNEFEPDNEAFGKNNMPKDVLKLIYKSTKTHYLPKVREMERMILEIEKKEEEEYEQRMKEKVERKPFLLVPWLKRG